MSAADEALAFPRPGRHDPMVARIRAANVGAALELERSRGRARDDITSTDRLHALERRIARLETALGHAVAMADDSARMEPDMTAER